VAALGAALAAWMPSAHTPPAGRAGPTPSYETMGTALAALYPGSRGHATAIVRIVHREADRHRLDPCLVMGVIAKESSFRPHARNQRDVGLMQLNLDWHPALVARAGGERALLDPEPNVRAGTELLAHYRRLAADDEAGTLRRYHGLNKRNDYVQRVRAHSRRLEAAGACVGETLQVAAR
jgi:soluble lytic murein transglycosylase-like protein